MTFESATEQVIMTYNQKLLDRCDIDPKDIPDICICELSGLVMDEPMRLPSKQLVEKKPLS